MTTKYAWKNFGYSLEREERALRELVYRGIFDAALPPEADSIGFHGLRAGCLALAQIDWLLSEAALAPPHGLDVLVPPPAPKMPALPNMPDKDLMKPYEAWYIERYEKLQANIETARKAIEEQIRRDQTRGAPLAAACKKGDLEAIRSVVLTTLARHPLPAPLSLEPDFALDTNSRVSLCTIQIPEFARLPLQKKRSGSWTAKWLPVSDTERRRSSERILHSLCVRAAYLVAKGDPGNFYDTVAVNAHQKWFDPATGALREGIVASLQASKNELCQLQPGHLDPKACFRHLSGISTSNILAAAPVRPIFVMDKNDKRIVPNKDVASQLEREANLAAMPWEDFEHLVGQLFEWMFASDGVDIKVTRASRDRGVDALMFDPDPIRGGKYVLQAKRYTRPVDVAAVRDLYGTVVNEGANRGILVTTASYGPDAYEFAKDKPISLIDGPNLIALLRKQGRAYRIDLEEARRLEAASGESSNRTDR